MELSALAELLHSRGIEYFGVLPVSRCTVARRHKLDRLPFRAENAVFFAVPYNTGDSPGRCISKYAVPRDYHLFFDGLFSDIIPELSAIYPGCSFRGFSDDSPFREREAAARCGVGVCGDNGLIITEKYGSYVFLGELVTDADIPSTETEPKGCLHCGLCARVCPSKDDCLSAVTQKKGELDSDRQSMMKKYRTAWGCDICQDVCPLNKGVSFTGIRWFWEDRIYAPRLGADITGRAYGWRGKAVIERNLRIIYGGSYMTSELLDQIKDAALEAGKIMLSAEDVRDCDISEKSGRANFVTKYDVQVQSYLKSRLASIIPDAAFVGEEGEADHNAEKIDSGICFIVDPIDGTTNFIFGARRSAVCIAVSEMGEITAGVVYNPYNGEMFSALKGAGAYLNGERIHTREHELKESVFMFGTSPYYKELQDSTWKAARALFEATLDLRRGGSAAIDLCWLASGRAGVFLEMRLSPWDYAAAKIILEEAGGKMTAADGSPVTVDRPSSVLAASSKAYDEALETVRAALA